MIGSDEKTWNDSKLPMLVTDLDINMVKPGNHYVSEQNKSSCVSLEATIDVSETIDKEMKIRATVINEPVSKRQSLVPDLIRLVFERLNLRDFHKARSISSDWYSTAELCNRQNPTPWLILFSSNLVSCKLFDPHENETYTVRDVGFDFHRSRCLANSGSWFLMLNHRTNFYLLNLFTRQMIRLPSLEAIDGSHMRFERISDSDFLVNFSYEDSRICSSGQISKVKIGNAVLWVDETSRDYLVVWNLDCFFAYHRKGDCNKTWKVFQHQGCDDMVFKDNKLYVLSLSRKIITVLDFSSGDSPEKCASFSTPDSYPTKCLSNLAVTLSGQVIIISSIGKSFFRLYKMDPETSSGWRIIKSLGDETLFLDLGITVAAAKDGVVKNCIYYSNGDFHRDHEISLCNNDNGICVYNIQYNDQVQVFQHLTDSSSPLSFKDARWFFPTFGGKWLL